MSSSMPILLDCPLLSQAGAGRRSGAWEGGCQAAGTGGRSREPCFSQLPLGTGGVWSQGACPWPCWGCQGHRPQRPQRLLVFASYHFGARAVTGSVRTQGIDAWGDWGDHQDCSALDTNPIRCPQFSWEPGAPPSCMACLVLCTWPLKDGAGGVSGSETPGVRPALGTTAILEPVSAAASLLRTLLHSPPCLGADGGHGLWCLELNAAKTFWMDWEFL